MTGSARPEPPGMPPGPPWSVDVLADLHAGVLEPEVAAALRPRVTADPAAAEVLAALDATVADLAALPPPALPVPVAARIDDALAAEAARRNLPAVPPAPIPPAPIPPVSLDAARRRRRAGWAGAGLLAAAAVAIGVVVVAGLDGQTAGTPVAGDSATAAPGSMPLALRRGALGEAVGETLGAADYGPLGGPGQLAACLAANGVPAAAEPLGVREVTLDGRPGVLIALPAGQLGRFRLLVVGPDCGPGNPSLLADQNVGAR